LKRFHGCRCRSVIPRLPVALAACVWLGLQLWSQIASATPPANDARPFGNPFATAYDRGPELLRVGLHMGSMHREGVGPRLWFIPWEYLQLSASYGYRTEHSVASSLSVLLFPRALLTPYATAGYALRIASLPYGLRLLTHQIVAGLGLEARVLDRYFVGVEASANTIWRETLKSKSTTIELSPSDRLSIESGFHLGVALP